MKNKSTSKKLTHMQIARVFALYVGSDLQCPISENPETNGLIKMGWYAEDIYWTAVEYAYCKLLLTPLSKMTDEHVIQIANHCVNLSGNVETDWKINRGSDSAIAIWFKNGDTFEIYTDGSGMCFREDGRKLDDRMDLQAMQMLFAWGYAAPLFIEAGHPDNGKNAIELGLAIDKTEK